MKGTGHTPRSNGLEALVQGLCYKIGNVLLRSWGNDSSALDEPRKFAESDNTSSRNVPDSCGTEEGDEVMCAEALERDFGLDYKDIVGSFLERLQKVLKGFLGTLPELSQEFSHSARSLCEMFACKVKFLQDETDSNFDGVERNVVIRRDGGPR